VRERDNKNEEREMYRTPGKCRFMKDGKCFVDYKDTRILVKLVTPQGKLFSRKRSGACAYCQRRIQIAVKRARLLGFLPFVGR